MPQRSKDISDEETLRRLLGHEVVEALSREKVAVALRVTALGGDPVEPLLERVLANVERSRSRLREMQKLAALGQVGAGITHELRNLMTGILGFAQIARRKLSDSTPPPSESGEPPRRDAAGARDLTQLIEKESLRCLDLLANFLGLSRPHPQDLEPLDPRELARAVARLIAHQLHLRSVKLELELAPDVPMVRGNAGPLEQVLLNLALNAMQALQPGGGQVTLSATRADDGAALIAVRDDGPGIAPPLLERIFDPFFTTKPVGDGTGLGLFVSRGIVEGHRGTLSVVSELGRGSTFTVRLPGYSAPR